MSAETSKIVSDPRESFLQLSLVALGATLLGFMFSEAGSDLVEVWARREEYSHGFFIPLISAFLVWRERARLSALKASGAWSGLLVLCAGLLLYLVGELSTLLVVVHYAMVVVAVGLMVTLYGWRGLRVTWFAFAFLVFMIPLPSFLYRQLSSVLQLVSSELGVEIIRWAGISVFLEGNIIDLGEYKLQVVEACDGLRYLFPLLSFGFLCACLYQGRFWQRAVLVLSCVPITVVMNSIRIGITGVLVEHQGARAADGFMHYFEGWVIFMACVGVLFAEVALFARLRRDGKRLGDVFALPSVQASGAAAQPATTRRIAPALAILPLLAVAAGAAHLVERRSESVPARESLIDFPVEMAGWEGRRGRLDTIYLDALKLTDYLIADYQSSKGDWVNLYVVYYASQRRGGAAHSPRACIPGGGWEIRGISTRSVVGSDAGNRPLNVNRVEIQRGEQRQLVYYWFQQRGRLITSEYMVKAYLLWDALTRGRTDGALIRLTTALAPGEDLESADRRLIEFARLVNDRLPPYLPE